MALLEHIENNRSETAGAILQLFSGACMVLLAIVIPLLSDLHAYGNFVLVRADIELLAAVMIYGFPRVFIVNINRGAYSRSAITRFGIFYIGGLIFFALVMMTFEGMMFYTVSSYLQVAVIVSILRLAQEFIRIIYVTKNAKFLYYCIASAPNIVLFFGVIISLFLFDLTYIDRQGYTVAIATLFLISALLSLLLSLLIAKRSMLFSIKSLISSVINNREPISYLHILKDGMPLFLQTTLILAMVTISARFLSNSSAELTGYFGWCLAAITACLYPLQIVAPGILSNSIKKEKTGITYIFLTIMEKVDKDRFSVISWCEICISLVYIFFVTSLIFTLYYFGNTYHAVIVASGSMFASIIPGYLSQLLFLKFNISGDFRTNSEAAAIKFSVLISIIFVLSLFGLDEFSYLGVCSGWLTAETLCAVYLLRKNRYILTSKDRVQREIGIEEVSS